MAFLISSKGAKLTYTSMWVSVREQESTKNEAINKAYLTLLITENQ